MFPAVVSVEPRDDFSLYLSFDNGEEGVLDMKPILHLMPLHKIGKISEFRTVHVAFDTIEWDCGVDLDPEYVYSNCRIAVKG